MLDKSMPFLHILMKRNEGAPIPEVGLPEGFSFQLFQPGDERDWAKIEASVQEFEGSELDAYIRFQQEYMPYVEELKRRCLFICGPDGEKVATAMAYWTYTGSRRDPWVHWISCKPEYQGLGLGKALVSRVLTLMRDIEGDRDFYLHTQTWSHKALKIYEKFGFAITREPGLGGYTNDETDQAVALLQSLGYM